MPHGLGVGPTRPAGDDEDVLTQILDPILHMSPLAVYLIVFALVFSEAAIFVGFIFPGETAVILGGVIASQGRVQLAILIPLVIVAAITGDSVGFEVGKRYGERVLNFKLLRHRRGGIDRAMGLLKTRGAWAVFIGRFTAFLRAVIPGLAGLSGMRYRTFLMANAAGGVIWGTGYVMLGYLVGNAYQRAEKYANWASYAVLALVVVAAVTLLLRSRRKERTFEEGYEATHPETEDKLVAAPAAENEGDR